MAWPLRPADADGLSGGCIKNVNCTYRPVPAKANTSCSLCSTEIKSKVGIFVKNGDLAPSTITANCNCISR